MANTNQNIPTSESELYGKTIEELDIIIGQLQTIKSGNSSWNNQQQKILTTATRLRREMEGTSRAISDSATGFEKVSESVSSLNRAISGIPGLVSGFANGVNGLIKPWSKIDDAANLFGKTVGGNIASIEKLRDDTLNFVKDNHIAAKYDTDAAEMIKLQQAYSTSVGRNLQLGDKQKESLVATSKLMQGNTNEFLKKLENMGVGLEKSGEITAKMFNDASRSGISFEKYSQTVTENLTKVQSYGFRNGVEGLTSMAKKAVEINMNIGEAFKVAEKIQTGGVQSAIKMGANLQVLGGSFSQMGDPMGLLYEGLNDTEALQDRLVKMFAGHGTLKNGQVTFGASDRMRMRAGAEAMGVSYDEMIKMASRQKISGEIENQIKRSGNRNITGDAELIELIKNTATLNNDGEAIVNGKKLSELTSADKDAMKDKQRSDSDKITDIAQNVRGFTEVQSGMAKQIETSQAKIISIIGERTKSFYKYIGTNNTLLQLIAWSNIISGGFSILTNIATSVSNIIRNIKGITAPFKNNTGGQSSNSPSSPGTPGASLGLTGNKYLDRMGANVDENGTIRSRLGIKIGNQGNPAKAARVLKGINAGAGGAVAGITTGLGYLMDGSFTSGNRSDKNKAIGGTVGAAIGGAALGALLGPMGAMLGAEAGKLLGEWGGKLWTDKQTKNRATKKKELTEELKRDNSISDKSVIKDFENLKGDYSKKELAAIKAAIKDGTISDDELKDKLLKKMIKSGDADLLQSRGTDIVKGKVNDEIAKLDAKVDKGNFNMETGEFTINNANLGQIEPQVAYARGGKLEGPSDINGPGMPIQGSNIVVGGGEYVINAESTRKNEPILDAINAGATFKFANGGIIPTPEVKFANGGIIPTPAIKFDEGGKLPVPIKISNILPSLVKNPMTPLKVAASTVHNAIETVTGPQKMEISPIKLDISGTIKLDSGGQQVDLNAIMNNPAFLSELSQMIERRLSDNINGGNFKDLRKNKRHNF